MLSSRQNLLQTTNMEFSAGWKPVPSRARVTRDAVSGFITMERRAVWKTVPHDKLIANIMNYIAPSPYGSVRTRSKRSRITDATDFIFHRFNNIIRYLLILDLLRIAFAPIRRGIPPARDNPWQSQRPTGANKSNNTKKIRERTDPSHRLYP